MEIGQEYGDDLRVVVFPVALSEQVADGASRVGDDALAEELLRGALHLHDDVVVLLGAAEDVENESLFVLHHSQLLRRQVGDIGDCASVLLEEGVKESDEVFLVLFSAEDSLETEVGQQMDVLAFNSTEKRCFLSFKNMARQAVGGLQDGE